MNQGGAMGLIKEGDQVFFRGEGTGTPYIGRVMNVIDYREEWDGGRLRYLVRPLARINDDEITDVAWSSCWSQWCGPDEVLPLLPDAVSEIWDYTVEAACEGLSYQVLSNVRAMAMRLVTLSDNELFGECTKRVYEATVMQRFPRVKSCATAMCALCFNESTRRDPDSEDHGQSIYGRAHAALLQGITKNR